MNESGEREWAKYFSGKTAESICENNIGYVFTGYMKKAENGQTKTVAYITQTNQTGDVQWTKTYGNSWSDSISKAHSIHQTDDGGFIVTGMLAAPNIVKGYSNIYLLKTDAEGNMLWETVAGGAEYAEYTEGSSVQQTSDGGYIVTGSQGQEITNSQGYSYYIPFVALYKFSADGSLQWGETYEGLSNERQDYGHCVLQSSDGGYLLTGETTDYAGYENMLLLKTDGAGNLIWQECFKAEDAETAFGYSVVQTADGGFIAAGNTRVGENTSIYLVKTDSDGSFLWDKTITYEELYSTFARSMQQTRDGGFILAGSKRFSTTSKQDIFVVKLGPEAQGVDEILVCVTTPTAITGVVNGTAKTASELGLPTKITLVTSIGSVQADVTWDVASSSYDPADTAEQTFTVCGTVVLPSGVINTNSVSLNVSINVTVNAAASLPAGPYVTPANINIIASGTGTFTISLGQIGNEADSATVVSNDTSIVTVNPANVTTSGQVITVTGVSAGNTTVTISFSGGSYTGGDKTVSVAVTDNVYTVYFHNNGSLYADKTVTSGSALGTNWPDNPTRSGYTFGGRYTGQNGTGAQYTSATVITADVDLYAKWMYSGGGGSSTPTTPSTPTYKADVKIENGTEMMLPVTLDKDVASGAWYNEAVSFIAAREITSGTGNGNYSPDAKLTRGEFIVLMMRAYGIAPDVNPTDNFSDAGNTYYTGYLAAAKRLGITAGVGNNMYAPGKEITRQEMFVLLYNALKVIGQLPQGDSGKTLSDFTDAGQISSWAQEAMTLLVKTGTVGGSNDKLHPTGTTTRAEMAQVLYNLLGK